LVNFSCWQEQPTKNAVYLLQHKLEGSRSVEEWAWTKSGVFVSEWVGRWRGFFRSAGDGPSRNHRSIPGPARGEPPNGLPLSKGRNGGEKPWSDASHVAGFVVQHVVRRGQVRSAEYTADDGGRTSSAFRRCCPDLEHLPPRGRQMFVRFFPGRFFFEASCVCVRLWEPPAWGCGPSGPLGVWAWSRATLRPAADAPHFSLQTRTMVYSPAMAPARRPSRRWRRPKRRARRSPIAGAHRRRLRAPCGGYRHDRGPNAPLSIGHRTGGWGLT